MRDEAAGFKIGETFYLFQCVNRQNKAKFLAPEMLGLQSGMGGIIGQHAEIKPTIQQPGADRSLGCGFEVQGEVRRVGHPL